MVCLHGRQEKRATFAGSRSFTNEPTVKERSKEALREKEEGKKKKNKQLVTVFLLLKTALEYQRSLTHPTTPSNSTIRYINLVVYAQRDSEI